MVGWLEFRNWNFLNFQNSTNYSTIMVRKKTNFHIFSSREFLYIFGQKLIILKFIIHSFISKFSTLKIIPTSPQFESGHSRLPFALHYIKIFYWLHWKPLEPSIAFIVWYSWTYIITQNLLINKIPYIVKQLTVLC